MKKTLGLMAALSVAGVSVIGVTPALATPVTTTTASDTVTKNTSLPVAISLPDGINPDDVSVTITDNDGHSRTLGAHTLDDLGHDPSVVMLPQLTTNELKDPQVVAALSDVYRALDRHNTLHLGAITDGILGRDNTINDAASTLVPYLTALNAMNPGQMGLVDIKPGEHIDVHTPKPVDYTISPTVPSRSFRAAADPVGGIVNPITDALGNLKPDDVGNGIKPVTNGAGDLGNTISNALGNTGDNPIGHLGDTVNNALGGNNGNNALGDVGNIGGDLSKIVNNIIKSIENAHILENLGIGKNADEKVVASRLAPLLTIADKITEATTPFKSFTDLVNAADQARNNGNNSDNGSHSSNGNNGSSGSSDNNSSSTSSNGSSHDKTGIDGITHGTTTPVTHADGSQSVGDYIVVTPKGTKMSLDEAIGVYKAVDAALKNNKNQAHFEHSGNTTGNTQATESDTPTTSEAGDMPLISPVGHEPTESTDSHSGITLGDDTPSTQSKPQTDKPKPSKSSKAKKDKPSKAKDDEPLMDVHDSTNDSQGDKPTASDNNNKDNKEELRQASSLPKTGVDSSTRPIAIAGVVCALLAAAGIGVSVIRKRS